MTMFKRTMRSTIRFLLLVFILPSVLALGFWAVKERPRSWSEADWSSSGIITPVKNEDVIHIMAARTGGIKGALSVHSWILVKRSGESRFTRYDKLGWGRPIRQDAYAADARWYSNEPFFVKSIKGEKASKLIGNIEDAIKTYPYDFYGGYGLWPGPNSNSFIAHVLNKVPELGAALPSLAVGRNFIGSNRSILIDKDKMNLQVSWRGLFGFAVGRRHGMEIHFMGLTAGIDVLNPALKLPGIGRIGFGEVRAFAGALYSSLPNS